MADQAEQFGRARRLAAARRVEQAVGALVTDIAFDPNEPIDLYTHAGDSMLRDVSAVISRSAAAPDAEGRLRAAGSISRTVANTLSADVPGIIGAQPVPGWVAAQVELRQADNRALIDALSGPPLSRGSQPWVPTPAPPLVGRRRAGRKRSYRRRRSRWPAIRRCPR